MLSKVALLPVITFIIFQGTPIAVYVLVLIPSPVTHYTTGISEIASNPPGSCIFSQMINIGAALMACTIYIRYRYVVEVASYIYGLQQLNSVSLIVGLTSTLGSSIAANFQLYNVSIVHQVGGFLYFTCGIVYLGTQSALTYYLVPEAGPRTIAHLRTILALCATLSFIIVVVFNKRVASTVAEWLLTLLFSVFVLSFVKEFGEIRRPKLTLLHNADTNDHEAESSISEEEYTTAIQPCINARQNPQITSFNRIDYYFK